MATVSTMEDFLEQTHKFVENNPDLIPISLDVGYGTCYSPSKKKKHFVCGDIRVPAEVFKPELQECLTTIRKTKISAFIFVPKDMVSDKVIEFLKEEPKSESEVKIKCHK